MPEVRCRNCAAKTRKHPSEIKSSGNFCSRNCSNRFNGPAISRARSGLKLSESTKTKLRTYRGERASGWKGGKPNCKDCTKEIAYRSTYCQACKAKHRTPEHQRKLGLATSQALVGRMPANIGRPGKFGNVKRGWFDINGRRLFFRSTWEANYALYLDFLVMQQQIARWEYEVDVFIFHKIQFGTQSFRPDFKIFNLDAEPEYHEVKGWMTPKSKTQINRMRIYYPNVKLTVIDRAAYSDIQKKLGPMLKFF